jgi:hypothetical protein
VLTPHCLPDLSDLHQTNLMALAVAQQWEKHRYAASTNLQLVTVARLLDKALRDYQSARKPFGEHDTMWEGVGPAIRPRNRGITVPLFRAIGHCEDLVAALDRILRILPALQASPELAAIADFPLPPTDVATTVRRVRNRIAHGDADIAKGKAGVVATLRPDPAGVQIGDHRLNFDELAQWLRDVAAYVRSAEP